MPVYGSAGDKLRTWLAWAEADLTTSRDALVIFLCLSSLHICANVLALTPEHSPLRTCPSVSLSAFFTTLGLLLSTTVALAVRAMYGYNFWIEAANTVVSIGCGSVLQLLAKADGFHLSVVEGRDECSLLVFFPASISWTTGEASSFLTAVIVFLRLRRAPPWGLPRELVLAVYCGVAVGVYFGISLGLTPLLSHAFPSNSTALALA